VNVRRLERPDLDDYRRASQVGAPYWAYLEALNTDLRFRTFLDLGVELVVAEENDEYRAACFVLPDLLDHGGRPEKIVWLFQLAATRDARNAGALLLLAMREWYPTMMSVGVTDEAARVYRAMGWKSNEDVWRCVRPIDIGAVRNEEGRRLGRWARRGLGVGGVVYTIGTRLAESSVGFGATRVAPSQPETKTTLPVGTHDRVRSVAHYLPVHSIQQGHDLLQAVDVGGIARIVSDNTTGIGRHRAHARLWKSLRGQGVRLIEQVALSPAACRTSLFSGYFPIRMPVYVWSRTGDPSPIFQDFARSGFGFADCDKIL